MKKQARQHAQPRPEAKQQNENIQDIMVKLLKSKEGQKIISELSDKIPEFSSLKMKESK